MHRLIKCGVVGCGMVFSVLIARGELVGDADRARAFAASQIRIERLRSQEKPDWVAIRREYEGLVPLIEEIDRLQQTDCQAVLQAALEQCAAGERPDVNQQVLAKGLQQVAVLAMTRQMDELAATDPEKRKAAAEVIAAYFEGIRPTLVRRDANFFAGQPTLQRAADAVLARLRAAVSADDLAGVLAARRELEDVLFRTYALSVLYEAQELEKLRASDRAACDVKRAEAQMFYRILEPRIKKRHAAEHEALTALWNGPYDAVSAELTEKLLVQAFEGMPLR